eukprot:626659-Amphidinium_carterae.1
MTIQELRAAIQEGEDLQVRIHGYYVGPQPPPLPSLQKCKERLEILETQRQEEEEEDRLEHHRQVEQR